MERATPQRAQAVGAPPAVQKKDASKGQKSALVGHLDGFAAQDAALQFKEAAAGQAAAAQVPEEAEANAQATGANAAAPQAEKLTPIREAMLAEMDKMEGKGVGMPAFDSVITADKWKELKAGGYTSCIDTQRVVSSLAFKAANVAIKRAEGQTEDMFAFGTETRERATALDAWVEGGPGSTPKPGDMLMLEKGGAALDKPGGEMAFCQSQFNKKKERAEKQLAELEAAKESILSAKDYARGVAQVEASLEKAAAELEGFKQILQPRIDAAQAKVTEQVKGGGKLAFSHVGFFKSREPEIGEDGAPTGKEIWHTMDGGQSGIAGAIDGQGAMGLTRIYDPKTNFISGEKSQGGAPRWLGGWIDIDKLVKSQPDPDAE